MRDTRVIKDCSGQIDLCETFSTIGNKLLQVDTGILYGHSCIDPIAGFDEHGKPFSRHEYEETDEKDEDENELS